MSVLSFLTAAVFAAATLPPAASAAFTMVCEHFLISTNMLVVGILAVFCWDSTFPDRRDVMVLAPLPLSARTMFLAKVAAVSTALGLTVILLHGPAGLLWPLAFAAHASPGTPSILAVLRWFAAYWFTMLASGAFIYCGGLLFQGVAAQLLPRRIFLRASGLLQLAAFCLFVSVYFLQPALRPADIFASQGAESGMAWFPSYWFLGLFHQLNGLMPGPFAALAHQAWAGLAITVGGTAVAYALSYLRTLRKIVEEPDIPPGSDGFNWLPPLGNRVQTAIAHFGIRTLARSRQHRMMLAFYWGIGLALTIFLLKSPAMRLTSTEVGSAWNEVNTPILAASIVMLALSMLGTRAVFTLPLELRANWIFRTTGIESAAGQRTITRRVLLFLSAAPVVLGSAALCFYLWPWRQAAGHVAVLVLLALCIADLCLYGFRKIPFTCSYLPGKSQLNMRFFAAVAVMYLVQVSVKPEREALLSTSSTTIMVLGLALAVAAVRYAIAVLSEDAGLQFEEEESSGVLRLGLNRDGAVLPSQLPFD